MIWNRLLGINAHVTVRKAYRARIEDYSALVRTLEEHPEVVGASAFIQSEGFALYKSPGGGVINSGVFVRGVDVERLLRTSDLADHLWAGDRVDLAPRQVEGKRADGIVIGRVLADRLGAMLGSEIYLMIFPKDKLPTQAPPMRRYVVTAIFTTGYYEFDSGLVFISLAAMRRDLGWGDVVTGIRLRLRDPFSAVRVSRELREVLRQTFPSLYPSSWTSEHGNLYVWIRMEKWFSFLALSLIVMVAGFNIISILTMNVSERRREIGILKAMGATPQSVGRIFTLEGLAIGITGVLLGDLVGFVLCWIQQRYAPLKLPGDVYIINALPVEMHFFDFAAISVSAVILCYLFTLLPARDAASLDPVDAIRYE
jgi:lipoprotein-releasing system permease protein